VYPGVTEEVCIPILEKESGLRCGVDFKVGYSPERINPGDHEHTLETVIKVVSGQDAEALSSISEMYRKICTAGVYQAPSIQVAEAEKVVENIQRDLNIALVNELALIFDKLGIDTLEVLQAAETKWNFHRYRPGLVGGHCIGVDPMYLIHRARQFGYEPAYIYAGRKLNESMAGIVAQKVLEKIAQPSQARVLVMGLSFKENVADYRNSKSADVITALQKSGVTVMAHDPFIDADTMQREFGVSQVAWEAIGELDAIIHLLANQTYQHIRISELRQKCRGAQPALFDLKRVYARSDAQAAGFEYLTL
jgi:UDP-N-acetyl-D-galactosamine dehydrogenase